MNPTKPGFKTTEFWGMVLLLVLTVGVQTGWLSPVDAEAIKDPLTALIAHVIGSVSNALVVWRYIVNRSAVKVAALEEPATTLPASPTNSPKPTDPPGPDYPAFA